MTREKAKKRAVAAIRRIVAAAKDLAQADAEYRKRPKRQYAEGDAQTQGAARC